MTPRQLLAVVAACSFAFAACNGDPSQGYGSGTVPAGPSATSGSGGSGSCDEPNSGCPCDEDGERIACIGESKVGDQKSCGPGEMVCSDGAWGDCVLNFALEPDISATSLGPSSSCNNSCSPTCQSFNDDPSNLGDTGTGVVETPDGLSLPGETAPAPGACTGGDTGSCSHSICTAGAALSASCDATAPGEQSCVTDICAIKASCCTTQWDASCIALIDSTCDAGCFADSDGACVTCFTDSQDHDGDGYSNTDGDCFDCDMDINPGAYDFAGNGIDEDCDGTPDNEVATCDQGIGVGSSNPFNHAKAIELCRQADANAVGSNRHWGVLDAKLVQADGTSASHYYGRGIHSSFGDNNLPRAGSRMAVYSTGTARIPGQSGYVNPNGQYASYNAGTSCPYPPGFPKNAGSCPNSSGNANDSSGLHLKIRVPSNAQGFRYNFNFLSSEYPEWVCTAYNDHFVALMNSNVIPPLPASTSNNISFDVNGNPASVNIALFTEPSCPTCSSPVLQGTGFDGTCGNGQTCGGATDWLYTTAPVLPGEDLEIHFSIWDQGDHSWDSTVAIDAWEWLSEPTELKTEVEAPDATTTVYQPGLFIRDYDASGACPAGHDIVWGHWSWVGTTPDDSSIEFHVSTATSAAALESAASTPLRFSNPPGPASLAGSNAIASQSAPDTQNGALVVDETLQASGFERNQPFIRITSQLLPSSDATSAPTLKNWNLQFECVASQ